MAGRAYAPGETRVPWDSVWRPIPGFPGYWISQYGQVFSMGTKRVLREWSNQWYGSYVTLRAGRKPYSRQVERLMKVVFADMLDQE